MPRGAQRVWLLAPGTAVAIFALASICLPVGSDGLGAGFGPEPGLGPALARWSRDLHDGFHGRRQPADEPWREARQLALRGDAEGVIEAYRRLGVRSRRDAKALIRLADRLIVDAAWDRAEWYVVEADALLGSGMLRNNLAWHYTQADLRPERALALARASVTAGANACNVDTLAWALYRNGRLDEAAARARQVLSFRVVGDDLVAFETADARASSRRLLALLEGRSVPEPLVR